MNTLNKIKLIFSLCLILLACSSPEKKEEVKKTDFQFNPVAPIDGKYSGIVELGGDGFNSFIINSDSSKNWFLEKAEFGVSNAYDNEATNEQIKTGLETYIQKMTDYNVTGKDIHFVVSSTARDNEKIGTISTILDSLGYVVNTVSDVEEARYALIATLPASFLENGFVVDIGSGNTKFAWYEGDKFKSFSTEGSKYYMKDISDTDASKKVKGLINQIPEQNRKHCFIIGGVPYKLAKTHRVGKERYTVLKNPEEYKAGDDQKVKSGLNIYKAIVDNTNPDYTIFDWESNFSIGFLLDVENLESVSE